MARELGQGKTELESLLELGVLSKDPSVSDQIEERLKDIPADRFSNKKIYLFHLPVYNQGRKDVVVRFSREMCKVYESFELDLQVQNNPFITRFFDSVQMVMNDTNYNMVANL
jgi:hypothetical protein